MLVPLFRLLVITQIITGIKKALQDDQWVSIHECEKLVMCLCAVNVVFLSISVRSSAVTCLFFAFAFQNVITEQGLQRLRHLMRALRTSEDGLKIANELWKGQHGKELVPLLEMQVSMSGTFEHILTMAQAARQEK